MSPAPQPQTSASLFLGCTLALLAPCPGALAQLGDRVADVTQRPPNSEIEIPSAPVLSPAEALRTFSLPPGFRIELVAAEPLVQDPIFVAFDARGRMWIAELSGYNREILERLPAYLDPAKPVPTRPSGRVVMLEDTDGDGRMDRRTVYADNLDMPRAIGFYRDQVLITDPPHLWLTRDRNGDGVMDEKTVLEANFGTPENVEGSPSGLLWGRDNWLYNASCAVRLRPRRDGTWERAAMPVLGHYGITQDDFGRLFYNGNSDHLRGDLVPSHYAGGLDRRIPFHGVNLQIASDQTTWPVRPTPGANRGYREGQLRDDLTLLSFSAASAPFIYRGDQFPPGFHGNAFVPDPAGNLVKRTLIGEVDGRLVAPHAYLGAEFVASTDERFRPVFVTHGPEGALYVADFYRGIIEGYQFATTYLRDQVLKRGLNQPLWGRGRIYRVVYEHAPRSRFPDMVAVAGPDLVALLTHENGWVRDLAQRKIVESAAPEAAAGNLRALLRHGAKPEHRAIALWCLEGLEVLEVDDALTALRDPDARVRMAAFTAAEPFLDGDRGAELVAHLRATIPQEHPLVLARAALSFARSGGTVGRELLWQIAARAGEHPTLTDSLLIALRGSEVEALRWFRDRFVADSGLTFGARVICEALAVHLVLAGDPGASALAGALRDRALPQLLRLALMRGATRLTTASLPEPVLANLARDAIDAPVRRMADAALVTLRLKKARATRVVTALTSEQSARFESGRLVYEFCSACHQADGKGRPGVAPSLVDGRWTNAQSAEAAIRILLHGKEGTPGFPAPMVPLASLPDEQLAAVLTYVRRAWGNQASAVEPDEVARARQQTGTRLNAWTDAELAKLFGGKE